MKLQGHNFRTSLPFQCDEGMSPCPKANPSLQPGRLCHSRFLLMSRIKKPANQYGLKEKYEKTSDPAALELGNVPNEL